LNVERLQQLLFVCKIHTQIRTDHAFLNKTLIKPLSTSFNKCRHGAFGSWNVSFLDARIPNASNALSYEGFAGTEVMTVGLPPPPPGAEGGNWGATWNLWTPIKVCKSQYILWICYSSLPLCRSTEGGGRCAHHR
jgi:hypothetical protein